MDGRDSEHFQQPDIKRLQRIPKLPVWIIEYAWAHKMMDIQEVVEPSLWPEVDLQPLTLKDSWRLRVASAQACSIMKNRDIGRFERVMEFLEATYGLLPRLVAPIKHMKIMFGLKTMVIMWMLREGQGIVDTVIKTLQFFPGKLPQYQDQCSHHEMFLMRKNHQDFKALAQTLAMDKDKLEDYIKNQMEKQYGEHYAQKLEDRLLYYLHELETLLPRDTYIDKLLKKEHPLTEEEKLLLEVITCDSTIIATSLKRLLHCDVASCRPIGVSQRAGQGAEIENAHPSKAALYASSSKALFMPVEGKTAIELQPEVMSRGDEVAQDPSKDSPVLLEDEDDSEVGSHQRTEEKGEEVEDREDECNCGALEVGEDSDGEEKNVARTQEEEEGNVSEEERKVGEQENDNKEREESQRSSESVRDAASPPQFCSRHQRWVRSILRECPDECSEELLAQADVTMSPALFQSSSSTSSSQDLTPSLLIPCPPVQQHPPPQTSTPPQAAGQVSEQATPVDKLGSGPPGPATNSPQSEPLPQPSPSSRDSVVAALLLPVVQLKNIISVKGDILVFQSQQVSSTPFTISSNEGATSTSQPQVLASPYSHISRNKEAAFIQPQTVAPPNPTNTTYRLTLSDLPPVVESEFTTSIIIPVSKNPQRQTAPLSQKPSASTSCLPPTRRPLSRLSRKFRQASTAIRHLQPLSQFSHIPLPEQSGKAPIDLQTFPPPLPNDSNISERPKQASTSTAQSGTLSLNCTANQIPSSAKPSHDQAVHPRQVTVPQAANSIQPHAQALNPSITPSQFQTLSCSTAIPYISLSDCLAQRPEASKAHRSQLRLSSQSQAVLLQSKLLQPYVRLTRLSQQECRRVTERRSPTRLLQSVEEEGNDDDDDDEANEEEGENQCLANSSFDLNTLYSSHDSSSSDSEDSQDSDPDYIPYIKKKTVTTECN